MINEDFIIHTVEFLLKVLLLCYSLGLCKNSYLVADVAGELIYIARIAIRESGVGYISVRVASMSVAIAGAVSGSVTMIHQVDVTETEK